MGPGSAIIRHEARRLVGGVGRTGTVAMLLLVVALVLLWPSARDHGVHASNGLFILAAQPGSPYIPAAQNATEFRVIPGTLSDLAAGRADLFLGDKVTAAEGKRGDAAARLMQEALDHWIDLRMDLEANQTAAYPLSVTMLQEDQAPPAVLAAQSQSPPPAPPTGAANQALAQLATNATSQPDLRPSQVQPPIPTTSLILTFGYLLPMNLVAQATGAAMLTDRFRHRTTLLLSTPHGAGRILVHRMVPTLAVSLAIWLVVSFAIHTSLMGAAAALPILIVPVFLGAVLGLASRSERELTFLLTAVTTLFSTFLFLPAFFSSVPAIAALSPVTVIAAGVRGEAISWLTFAASTIPLTLLAVSLGMTARALHHEEAMASQFGPLRQIVRALSRLVRGPLSMMVGGFLAVPFTLVVELLWLAFVIPLGLGAALPFVILGAAAIEELAKLAVSRAWAQRGGGNPARTGLFVGTGFFIGEKAALVIAIVGFAGLPQGGPALAILGLGTGWLLLAPLFLHTATGALSAYGATRWSVRRGWMLATLVHFAYNTALIGVLQ